MGRGPILGLVATSGALNALPLLPPQVRPAGCSVRTRPAASARRRREPIRRFVAEGGAGMVSGMATKKVTITLGVKQLQAIRQQVALGASANVSSFIQHAVETALHDVAGWSELLGQALEQTGGPPSAKERAWADGILSTHSTHRRKRPAA